jgi:hypothetical protein
LGGSFARNIERKSWTKSAAAMPVISAKGTVKTSIRKWIFSLLTVIIGRCNLDNVGTSLKISSIVYRNDCDSSTYIKFRPARPLSIRLSSLVVQPPASGVPAKIWQEVCMQATKRNELTYSQEQDPDLGTISTIFQKLERKNRTYHVYIKTIRRALLNP